MGKNFHVDCFRCEVSDSDREATSYQLQKFIARDSIIVTARLFVYAVNRNYRTRLLPKEIFKEPKPPF